VRFALSRLISAAGRGRPERRSLDHAVRTRKFCSIGEFAGPELLGLHAIDDSIEEYK